MHTIVTDTDAGLIEITVEGFWTLEHVARFAADIRANAREVRRTGKRQVILYDYTRASIQSADVVEALQRLARDNALRSRKVALFTGSLLAKRQAVRIAREGEAIQVFDNRDAAIAWLKAA
jgi:hypothetical protein